MGELPLASLEGAVITGPPELELGEELFGVEGEEDDELDDEAEGPEPQLTSTRANITYNATCSRIIGARR